MAAPAIRVFVIVVHDALALVPLFLVINRSAGRGSSCTPWLAAATECLFWGLFVLCDGI
jgi:hypothetical protein